MRNSRRVDLLEIEIYKLQIELDLLHEIINTVISSMSTQIDNQRIDSGKWYPVRTHSNSTIDIHQSI